MIQVSIITICLNDREGLEKTVVSVIGQSYRNLEHIIIDGGSSDGSLEIINKYINYFNYSVSEKDNGIYDAMNKGIHVARGKYLLFLNAGDIFANNEVLQNIFCNELQAEIVYGNITFDHGKDGLKRFKQPTVIDLEYLMIASPQHPATFIAKSAFEAYGYYNLEYKLASDYEFFFRVFVKHSISSQYLDVDISIFDTTGISSSEKHRTTEIFERKKTQAEYLPPIVIKYFEYNQSIINKIPKIILHKSKLSRIVCFGLNKLDKVLKLIIS